MGKRLASMMIHLCVDFGWTNPACIIAVGIDGEGRARVLNEVWGDKITMRKLFEKFPKNIKKVNKNGTI